MKQIKWIIYYLRYEPIIGVDGTQDVATLEYVETVRDVVKLGQRIHRLSRKHTNLWVKPLVEGI